MTKKQTFALILLAIVVFLLLLPTYFSTPAGRAWLFGKIATSDSTVITAKESSFSWFGTQRLEGFLWKDRNRGFNLTIDSIEIDQGIIPFLITRSLGKATADGVKLIVQAPKLLVETPKSQESGESEKKARPFLGLLTIRNGQVTYLQDQGSPIIIEQIQLSIEHLTKEGPFKIDLKGNSRAGVETGSFNLNSKLQYSENELVKVWQSPIFTHFFPNTKVEVNLLADNFPTVALDQTLSLLNPPLFLGINEAFGPKISIKFLKEIQGDQTLFDLKFEGETLLGEGKVQLSEDKITIEKPLQLDWTITPDWFHYFTHHHPFPEPIQLKANSHLKAALKELTYEKGLKVTLDLQLDKMAFLDLTVGDEFQIEGLHILSKVDPHEKIRELNIDGTMQWRKEEMSINLQGKTREGTWSPLCFEECAKGNWDISLKNVPLSLYQILNPQAPHLVSLFGERLTTDLQIKEGELYSTLNASFATEKLHAKNIELSISDTVSLLKPFLISYDSPIITNHFVADLPLQMEINSLSFKFSDLCCHKFHQLIDSLALKAEIKGSLLSFPMAPNLTLTKSQMTIDKSQNHPFTLNATNELRFKDTFAKLLGETLDVTTTFRLFLNPGRKWTIDPLEVNLKSNQLQGHLQAIMEDGFVQLTIPATALFKLTPAGYNQFIEDKTNPKLIAESSVFIKIAPFKRAISIAEPFFGHATVEASLNQFALEEALLNPLKIDLDINGFTNEITIEGVGRTEFSGSKKPGAIEGHFKLIGWHNDKGLTPRDGCMSGFIKAQDFPTPLLSPYISQKYLTPYLGEIFSAKIEAVGECGAGTEGTLFVGIESNALQLTTHFKVSDEFFSLYETKEAKNSLNFHVDPDRFCQILQQLGHEESACRHLFLKRPFDLTLNFTQAILPNIFEKTNHSIYLETLLAADLKLSEIELYDQDIKEELIIPALKGQLLIPTVDKLSSLTLKTKTPRPIDKNKTEIELEATLRRQQKDLTQFDLSDITGSLSLKSKLLPLRLFSELLFLNDSVQAQISSLLGNSADINAKLDVENLNGSIILDLSGISSAMHLNGLISNGVLTLKEPLQLSLTMNTSVAKSVISEIVPILDTAVKGKEPIEIVISPEGFSLPLVPFSPINATVEKGMMDLNILELRIEDALLEIFTILKITTSKPTILETVWFTPLYFSFSKGILKMERVDMLLSNRFPLALWGTIDFGKDKMNLTLGIGAKTLENAFSLKGLPEDTFLPVPIRGTIEKPKIDKTRAALKIASLIAEMAASGPGRAIGNILDIITGGPKEEAIPEPTTKPFPWEKENRDKPLKKSSKIKSLFKSLEKGLKS